MKKTILHLMASAALLGGLSVLAWQPANLLAAEPAGGDAERTAADAKPAKATAAPSLPPGVQRKELDEAGDIRNAFEEVTEAAFSGDVIDEITKRLVDADRDRMAKWDDRKLEPLQNRIGGLQKMWRDKYGKEFNVDERVVFGGGFLAIVTGEVSDPAQLAGKWPLTPVMPGDAQTAAGRQPPREGARADTEQQRREAAKPAGGNVNLDKGRNVAVVRLPASHGQPELTASLIHENPDIWRFDVPDNVDGPKLNANLLQQLKALADNSAKWPNDINEAQRLVAHHVLLALYDVQPPAKPKADAAGDQPERKASD
jgi:hypothetical protein